MKFMEKVNCDSYFWKQKRDFPPTKFVLAPYLLPTSSLYIDKDQVGRRYEVAPSCLPV